MQVGARERWAHSQPLEVISGYPNPIELNILLSRAEAPVVATTVSWPNNPEESRATHLHNTQHALVQRTLNFMPSTHICVPDGAFKVVFYYMSLCILFS